MSSKCCLLLFLLLVILAVYVTQASTKDNNKRKDGSENKRGNGRKNNNSNNRGKQNRNNGKNKDGKKSKQTRRKRPCKVTSWENWAPAARCLADCKLPCRVIRTRRVSQKPVKGGRKCPELKQTMEKRLCTPKTNDCFVAGWSAWSRCSSTCGTECVSKRTRRITRAPGKTKGIRCPKVELVRKTKLPRCSRDCQVSSWSTWSSCGQRCGSCTRSSYRNVQSNPYGRPCPTLIKHENHYLGSCPYPPDQDCIPENWENWSSCSRTCGSCTVTRHRHIKRHSRGRGRSCGSLHGSKAIALGSCPDPAPPVRTTEKPLPPPVRTTEKPLPPPVRTTEKPLPPLATPPEVPDTGSNAMPKTVPDAGSNVPQLEVHDH